MSPARAQTLTARSRDECTNHEATAPSTLECIPAIKAAFMSMNANIFVTGAWLENYYKVHISWMLCCQYNQCQPFSDVKIRFPMLYLKEK